jgi:hypothetical protein
MRYQPVSSRPSSQTRPARSLAVAAGRVLSLAAAAVPSLLATTASAQTAFEWAAPVDGLWSNTMNWSPMGSPGAGSNSDTATLGLMGPYTVTLDVSRTIGGLNLSNPEVVLLLEAGRSLNLAGNAVGFGTLIVSQAALNATSTVRIADGVVADVDLVLDGTFTSRAIVTGPTGTGTRATIGASSTATGVGEFDGLLDLAGTITAEGVDGRIDFDLDDDTITGGGTLVDLDGVFDFNGHTLTNITVSGTPALLAGDSLTIGAGVVFTDPLTVSDAALNATSTVRIADGVVADVDLVLDGTFTSRAIVTGPTGTGTRATIGASSTATGVGEFDGLLDLAGTITAEGVDGRIDFDLDDDTITGGGTLVDLDGVFDFNGHTLTNITVSGTPALLAGDSLTIGAGVVFTDPLTVSDAALNATSTVRIADGVVADVDLVLDGTFTSRAIVTGPTGTGTRATIGASSTATGVGEFDGLLDLAGTITAEGDDGRIDFDLDDDTITGGGTLVDLDGVFDFNGHTLTNITVSGTPALLAGDSLTIGAGVVFTDPLTVSDAALNATSTVRIADGVVADVDLVLDGTFTSRAIVTGPTGTEESAGFTPGSVISGRGQLDGNIPVLPNVIRPGTSTNPDTIAFSLSGGTTFTDTTNLQIGFAGVEPGEFGQIQNSGNLNLDGTLRVTALGGFEPLSTNEIEIISGGTITGRFDTVEYTGNLEPGDVARAFYEDNRVVFAVTCNADVTLPAGVLNIFDVVVFINTWNAQGPGSDFNEDGVVNILDVVAFISLWNVGCPE